MGLGVHYFQTHPCVFPSLGGGKNTPIHRGYTTIPQWTMWTQGKWPAEKDLPLGTQAEHSNCGRSRRIEFLNDWRLLHSPHYQTTMKLLCGFCWLNHVNPIPYTIPYSSNVTAVCDTMREYEKQLAIPKTKWCMVLPRVHHFP